MTIVQTKAMALSPEYIRTSLQELYGTEFTAPDVRAWCAMNGCNYQTVTKKLEDCKVGRGKWNLEVTKETVKELEVTYNAPAAAQNLIPQKDDSFVQFGNFTDIKKIIKSGLFYPSFITGLSGNGKTFSVEQACAQMGRELIRVNITIETDEDDLMGGHTLQNGNIIFREGPVIKAMRKGAVLLLDEVDLGSNKLMCLQSVLEGKGYLIKKTGEWVKPADGFTILATANTKGQGSEDGKFIGTQIMNEAMLERFAITMQQEYPPVTTERSILKKEMALTGPVDEEFCTKLVDWADIIRKTYYEGAIDDVITTRRLVHIVNAYRMFGDKLKSIQMCISRFDEDTRNSILDLYTKIDAGVNLDEENPLDESETSEYNEDYDV